MPTYEYECKKCKEVREIFHSMTETRKQICPDCGSAMTKLISGGAGIIFKGSGFYATDYKKKEKPSDGDNKQKKIGESNG